MCSSLTTTTGDAAAIRRGEHPKKPASSHRDRPPNHRGTRPSEPRGGEPEHDGDESTDSHDRGNRRGHPREDEQDHERKQRRDQHEQRENHHARTVRRRAPRGVGSGPPARCTVRANRRMRRRARLGKPPSAFPNPRVSSRPGPDRQEAKPPPAVVDGGSRLLRLAPPEREVRGSNPLGGVPAAGAAGLPGAPRAVYLRGRVGAATAAILPAQRLGRREPRDDLRRPLPAGDQRVPGLLAARRRAAAGAAGPSPRGRA